MSKANSSAREQLLKLEKLVNKVIRKSLKNNTLDYTCQITVSSLEPKKIKYAIHISSPAPGVQPVTMVYDNFDLLVAALEEAEKEFNPQKVEIAFHNNRMNSYKNKIKQHEQRVKVLEDPNYDPETDSVAEALKEVDQKIREKNEATN
jgi:hypothetical protein